MHSTQSAAGLKVSTLGLPESREVRVPQNHHPFPWIHHHPCWSSDGPEEGGCSTELATPNYHQGDAAVPGVRKLVQAIHIPLQPTFSTSHLNDPTKEQELGLPKLAKPFKISNKPFVWPQLSHIQTPISASWWRWIQLPWEQAPFCPNGEVNPLYSIHVRSFQRNCPRRSRTMMWGTENFWPSSSPLKSGGIGLEDAKRLNPRQARWALFFTRFRFTITYRPGNKYTKADALFCLHQPDPQPDKQEPILPASVFVSPITWALDSQIEAATRTEPGPPGGPEGKIFVPTSLCHSLLDSVHTSPGSGHPDNPIYRPGDRIWLSTRDIRLRLPSKKLSPRYIGPFPIARQINESTRRPPPPPPPKIISDNIFGVHKILDSWRRGGRLQYLVDWEGYSPKERSWVDRDDILYPTLLSDFHQAHPDRPAPRARGHPRCRSPDITYLQHI
ncbi:hypothetical protein H4Q32_005754 [Labeo rohita]|uniref:Chromo domain-containing protein n=1 Tax=Labeo rohita TaxID=84645 RepID=A0ABQ8LPD2_LABRO|nr:hypothetical protein H4Q32_005754 [Labeo rohita]